MAHVVIESSHTYLWGEINWCSLRWDNYSAMATPTSVFIEKKITSVSNKYPVSKAIFSLEKSIELWNNMHIREWAYSYQNNHSSWNRLIRDFYNRSKTRWLTGKTTRQICLHFSKAAHLWPTLQQMQIKSLKWSNIQQKNHKCFLCLFDPWWGWRKHCWENSECRIMVTDTNTPCLKEGKLSAFYKIHEPE